MEQYELIGFAAGLFTTMSFLPQVLKSCKSKSTKDISWGYLAMFFIGVSLWLAYGLMANSISVIAANMATMVLLLALIFLKTKYG